jgi:hypothetical protein
VRGYPADAEASGQGTQAVSNAEKKRNKEDEGRKHAKAKKKRRLSELKPGDLDGDSVEEVVVLSDDCDNEEQGGGLSMRGTKQRGTGGDVGERPFKKMKKVGNAAELERREAVEEGDSEIEGLGQGEAGKGGGKKKKRNSKAPLADADAFHR